MSQTTAPEAYATYQVRQDLKPTADGLSEKLLDQHWKLYEGYVTNSNLLNKSIWDCLTKNEELNKPQYAELQRRLGFEYNGMVLHEYYFGAMKAGSAALPATSDLSKKFAKDFGSFDAWKKQFVEVGKMRGIGWAITYYDPQIERLLNFWITDHEMGHIAGFIPVVVMDVWEHAYVTDYGASAVGRGQYIDTYFKNIDWATVSKRFEAAAQMKLEPRAALVRA